MDIFDLPNIFELPGPQFLLFYIAFGAVVAGTLYALFLVGDGAAPMPRLLGDPYQIAGLRGGPKEAARVGVLSLVDRNLAQIRGDDLFVPPGNRAPLGLHPIERAIFQCCSQSPVMARNIPQDPRVSAACAVALGPLIATGLVPNASARAQRVMLTAIAGAVVIGIGVTKLAIAAERGRSNVGFLVMLMAAALVFFAWLAKPPLRTRLGSAMLADLRRLFEAARAHSSQIRPGTSTAEALLLAGVFGFLELPGIAGFSEVRRVYRPPKRCWGCGSSCGSGCGGGGGDGGGGCGGCGSG